ncbi:hypothetical protein BC834DRAFT_965522 [Gloeopeniophorella convolvens]|nr:hypothetical protein BC834DRAFT_965522 [Gloeopeniophorella convolvens]
MSSEPARTRLAYINPTPHPTQQNFPASPAYAPISAGYNMHYDRLPLSPSQHPSNRPYRRWRIFVRSTGFFGTAVFFSAIIFAGMVVHLAFFSSSSPFWSRPVPSNWNDLAHLDPSSPGYVDPNGPLLVDPNAEAASPVAEEPSPSPVLDESPPVTTPSRPLPEFPSSRPPTTEQQLTNEQVRSLVSRTRGYFSREYSLGLGWNNMRYIIEASLLQAELLNRTLVVPSFVYARACEYNITVCAEFAPMVNKGQAIGWDAWKGLPIEQQMGFRIPISLMLNLTHLRERHPVITVADFLRYHDKDPMEESSSGMWQRWGYQTNPNVFETNKTKIPTSYVIENHWYDPKGTNRVDFIPEAMKTRGRWERVTNNENQGPVGHWPPIEPTELSITLATAMPEDKSVMDFNAARGVLMSAGLEDEFNLDDDEVVEGLLNAHGWEVLHTFQGAIGMDYTKTVIDPFKEVAHRSSIKGFRDDYWHADADVVILTGETHLYRKPGCMRFTTKPARGNFASMVLRDFAPPQRVLDLANLLSARMRALTGGRLWMGAHMRRGDFVNLGWAMELSPEAHVGRVKDRLGYGRTILQELRAPTTVYPLPAGVAPDAEQTALAPPQPEDVFFIATDEREPGALRAIQAGGAVFMADLLTMDDRRAFGWPLMLADVRALVEQAVLVRAAFFYGHGMSSLAGGVLNMRAVRGADPRTALID